MSLDDLQLSPHVAATSTDAPSSPGEFAAFQLGIAMTDTGGHRDFIPTQRHTIHQQHVVVFR